MGTLPKTGPAPFMKLELTPSDYHKLVELTYLGEWLINAHHDPEFSDDTATAVLQQLLAAGPAPGTTKDDETGEYFMDTDWTDRLYDQYILDYDDHVFWDELTERLASRDLAKQRGINIEDVNRDDDLADLRPLEDQYRAELEDNGIDRLRITDF
jgi:hypothetical protein